MNNMRLTQRRILASMLELADDEMVVHANARDIVFNAGYKATGGAHTDALILLEQSNHIVKLGEDQWLVTV